MSEGDDYEMRRLEERAVIAESTVASLQQQLAMAHDAIAVKNRALLQLSDDANLALQETDALKARLRALREQWRGMVENANAEGPIPGDEIGHPSRWTAVEMCADELDALLVDPVPQEKP